MRFIRVSTHLSIVILLFTQSSVARDTWEKRAAERFTPLTAENKRQIIQAQPKAPFAPAKQDRRILVFWRCEGFIHTSIPWANFALREMAKASKAFTVDLADDYSVFTPSNLSQYDAILFNNTTHLKFPEESMRKSILDFINSGKGIIGIHAASDNFYEWAAGAAMMGGQFCGHPWTADGTWAFKLNEPAHTLNQAFHGRGFWHQDEIYQYDPQNYQTEEKLRILVSLDMSKENTASRLTDPKYATHNEKFNPGMREVPVTWVRAHGKGRLFNTNFGHREETYTKPVLMNQLLDGIQYALGDLEADDRPTARVNREQPALAPEL